MYIIPQIIVSPQLEHVVAVAFSGISYSSGFRFGGSGGAMGSAGPGCSSAPTGAARRFSIVARISSAWASQRRAMRRLPVSRSMLRK